MRLFDLLKSLFTSNKKPQQAGQAEQTQKNIEKPVYVETKKTENYTDHERIYLTAYVSEVKENNLDGINRQEILAKCKEGDPLTFCVIERKAGYKDIEVYTEYGCIGLMSFSELQKIARYMINGGTMHNARILELKQPKTSRGKIECKISFERNKMR